MSKLRQVLRSLFETTMELKPTLCTEPQRENEPLNAVRDDVLFKLFIFLGTFGDFKYCLKCKSE